jgi:tetratricopeptide (TPR) repeat protein
LWQIITSSVLLVFGFAVVVRFYGKLPYLATGWLWYIGTLVPVSGLVQIGLWPAMADRWAYVPFVGLFLIIVWGVSDLFGRWRPRFIGAMGISCLLILGISTSFQLCYWRNSLTLFEHTLAVTKNNYIMHRVLGSSLQSQNRLDEAIAHYRQSIRICPSYIKAQYALGYALCKQGKWNEALVYLQKAVQIYPGYADAQHGLGYALYSLGRLDEAIVHFRLAIKLKPDYPEAYYNLANILSAQGKPDEAIACYRKATEIKPDYAIAHNNLGIALQSQGRLDEAINHFRLALKINPQSGKTHYNLANALHAQGRLNEAIKYYERAAELATYQDVTVLETLAAAYADAGRFEQAITVTQTAINLAAAAKNNELADNLRKQLEIYKQAKP